MEYNGINAKVSGMFGHLMKRPDYEALSRIGSVEEAGAFLGTFPSYRRGLEGLSGADMRRGVIERRLLVSLYDDFHRIYSFIGDFGIRKFLDAYFLRFEIYVLKLLLCMAYDERDISADVGDINPLLFAKWHINPAKLRTAKNVPELIEGLKGTEFYPVLSRVYNENRSMFELDIQLDLYYYMRLRESISLLDKPNARLMTGITEVESDLHNIIWIYRLKTYYQVNGSLIYTYLIPYVRKRSKDHISRLVNTATQEELVHAINTGPYGVSFSASASPEDAYDAHMSKAYSSARRQNPKSLAAVAAYMYFREREVKNITSMLEGVRYGLKPGDIMNGGRGQLWLKK